MKKIIGAVLATMVISTASFAGASTTSKVIGGVIVVGAIITTAASAPVVAVTAAGIAVGGMVAGKEIDVACDDIDLRRKITDDTYSAVVDVICE